MFACLYLPEHSEPLLEIARDFSPWIERPDPATAIFSILGLGRLFGPPPQTAQAIHRAAVAAGAQPQIALAANPDTAVLAAYHFPEITIITPGAELEYLGLLPLNSLPLDPALYETLSSWGVRTLRDLARLPADGLHERLGPQAVYWRRAARGEVSRPLNPLPYPTLYERRQQFEHPLDALEPLLFLLTSYLTELTRALDRASLAAAAIHLQAGLEHGEHARSIRLPFPTRDVKFLRTLLERDLETHPPQSALLSLALALEPARPRRIQHDLFTPASPEPERLALTLDKIRSLVGAANAGSPELLDSWHPHAWKMSAPGYTPAWSPGRADALTLALRFFRPPHPARVELIQGAPRRLSSPVLSGTVKTAAGPWRSSGDCFLPSAYDRDDWDLALDSGPLCRIFFTRPTNSWFLEGLYD